MSSPLPSDVEPSAWARINDPKALSWIGFAGLIGFAVVAVSLLEGGMIVHVVLGTTSGFSLSFANRASAAIVLVGSGLLDTALILKIAAFGIGRFKSSRTPRSF